MENSPLVDAPVPLGAGATDEPSHLLGIALGSAAVLLLTQSILASLFTGQSFWKTDWMIATVFMGSAVSRWPAVFDLAPITAALTALYPIALTVVLLLCTIVDRLNKARAMVAGSMLGLVFYFVDLYGLVGWFPWLVQERDWMMFVSHLVFGAAAAWLLVERAAGRKFEIPQSVHIHHHLASTGRSSQSGHSPSRS